MKKYTSKNKLFWMAIFIAICQMSSLAQSVEIQGSFSENLTLDADTVKIVGNVEMLDGTTLTVEAGTYVEVEGYFMISLTNASLIAAGTEEAPITFTVNESKKDSESNVTGNWDGFHIRNSYTNDTISMSYCTVKYCKCMSGQGIAYQYGAAMSISSCHTVNITNCQFINNMNLSFDDNEESRGGAIYAQNIKSFVIEDCLFQNNTARDLGGAISIVSTNSSFGNINRNTFTGNTAIYGSAIYISGNSNTNSKRIITISNNKITNNNGITIYISSFSGASVYNNIIVNNNGYNPYWGGASHTSTAIFNNTIVNNYSIHISQEAAGGAIFTIGNEYIYNNILYANGSDMTGTPQIYYFESITEGPTCFNNCVSYPDDNPNSFADEPRFVNPSFGLGMQIDVSDADWSLQDDSPCINAGAMNVSAAFPATDFLGDTRIFDDVIDIGAIEYQEYNSIGSIFSTNISKSKVYPNPGCSIVNVEFDSGKAFVQFYNLNGTLMLSEITVDGSIDTKDLNAGTYYYRIIDGCNVYSGKWIKKQ